MPGPLFATDGDVSLRTAEEDDLEFIQANRNHPDVRGPLTDSTPRNYAQVEEYFEDRISDDDTYHFLVCDETGDDPDPVGVVALPWIRQPHGVGNLMYWTAPEHQGNGYVTAGTRLLLDFAFREQGLHKVTANVLESNAASQRVLEKLRFEQEGRQREECIVDGEREDFYRYGLLAPDWLE